MLFLPWKMLFMWILLIGSLITMSASSWFVAWIGLEINMLALLVVCLNDKSPRNTEAILKYFLVQALASSILIMSALLTSAGSSFMSDLVPPASILLLSLLIKLGSAPLHAWVPQIMEGLSWFNLTLILTWQKIAPFFLLVMCLTNKIFFTILMSSAILSAALGAINGLSHSSIRKILAYSSINHMGWMLSIIPLNFSKWLLYFLFYSVILISILMVIVSCNMNSLAKMNTTSKSVQYSLLISLFSFSGLPPFTGFFPKWLVITSITEFSLILSFILVLSSLLTLYFYLRIGMQVLTQKTKSMKTPLFSLSMIPLSINLFGLMLTPFLM